MEPSTSELKIDEELGDLKLVVARLRKAGVDDLFTPANKFNTFEGYIAETIFEACRELKKVEARDLKKDGR